ncbi:hypothetical protein Cgig2_028619 [Carnegiea gigantea]|uniref:Uncharacterized protein n=1 Tax=Carnegiea gigantea TaxID=171969 RepID=A0A9Q1K5J9_9CARY|nr:hypothetical protein Cgig2_028619 [Carnegiea gigantea]
METWTHGVQSTWGWLKSKVQWRMVVGLRQRRRLLWCPAMIQMGSLRQLLLIGLSRGLGKRKRLDFRAPQQKCNVKVLAKLAWGSTRRMRVRMCRMWVISHQQRRFALRWMYMTAMAYLSAAFAELKVISLKTVRGKYFKQKDCIHRYQCNYQLRLLLIKNIDLEEAQRYIVHDFLAQDDQSWEEVINDALSGGSR